MPNKRRKVFLSDKDKALEMVQEATRREEDKVAVKQHKLSNLQIIMQERHTERKNKREQKRTSRNKERNKLLSKQQKKLDSEAEGAAPPMSSGKTAAQKHVSFAYTPMVNTFVDYEAKGKKKLRKGRVLQEIHH
eukprot:NODE_4537_length_651_cov_40.838870_g3883_i0.p1 GENE.NODE_4537_length_651_cov_40.838870_g3883_i0~~NODE_4537_length_651_cov_40.838870_g3883_i0.p1  ORF type:complete len:134 (+),score=42.82 NODE_4537_length_651_cov_40.838870_g3883_i0:170-571(+)